MAKEPEPKTKLDPLEKEFDKALEKVLAAAPPTDVKNDYPDLDKDFNASAARLEALRAGRNLGDIPLNDEYFKARAAHMKFHDTFSKEK